MSMFHHRLQQPSPIQHMLALHANTDIGTIVELLAKKPACNLGSVAVHLQMLMELMLYLHDKKILPFTLNAGEKTENFIAITQQQLDQFKHLLQQPDQCIKEKLIDDYFALISDSLERQKIAVTASFFAHHPAKLLSSLLSIKTELKASLDMLKQPGLHRGLHV